MLNSKREVQRFLQKLKTSVLFRSMKIGGVSRTVGIPGIFVGCDERLIIDLLQHGHAEMRQQERAREARDVRRAARQASDARNAKTMREKSSKVQSRKPSKNVNGEQIKYNWLYPSILLFFQFRFICWGGFSAKQFWGMES